MSRDLDLDGDLLDTRAVPRAEDFVSLPKVHAEEYLSVRQTCQTQRQTRADSLPSPHVDPRRRIGKYFRDARIAWSGGEDRGSKYRFAKELRFDGSNVGRYESGEKLPGPTILKRFADRFGAHVGVSYEQLRNLYDAAKAGEQATVRLESAELSKEEIKARRRHRAPVLGESSCGPWLRAREDRYALSGDEDWHPLPPWAKPGRRYGWIRVQGDSMNQAGYEPGDIILIDHDVKADFGDKAVVILGHGDEAETTVKYFKEAEGGISLEPRSSNRTHKAKYLSAKDWDQRGGQAWKIVGWFGFRQER